MKQYLDLLHEVLHTGTDKGDRTGTGTRSVFGRQMRFNLQEGFPLLTTKKMFMRGCIEELLWILRGSTDVKELQAKNVRFWDSWVDENGTIGEGYGKQMRRIAGFSLMMPKRFPTPEVIKNDANIYGIGIDDGRVSAEAEHHDMLFGHWADMLRRCYQEECDCYKGYGAHGVHVDESWHDFTTFYTDVQKIPGWALKQEHPFGFVLDCATLYGANKFSKETAAWVTVQEQEANASIFAAIAYHRDEMVPLYREIDQLKSVIADLKHNPNSRRIQISLWNPQDVDRTTLPPCHGNIIQFYVAGGELSCQMYQRSCDMFLGVPVNIASYALLTHILANFCGLKVGELSWIGGDVHVYHNHVSAAVEQLYRAPGNPPRLTITRTPDNVWGHEAEDFVIEGYDPWPSIKAEVSV